MSSSGVIVTTTSGFGMRHSGSSMWSGERPVSTSTFLPSSVWIKNAATGPE